MRFILSALKMAFGLLRKTGVAVIQFAAVEMLIDDLEDLITSLALAAGLSLGLDGVKRYKGKSAGFYAQRARKIYDRYGLKVSWGSLMSGMKNLMSRFAGFSAMKPSPGTAKTLLTHKGKEVALVAQSSGKFSLKKAGKAIGKYGAWSTVFAALIVWVYEEGMDLYDFFTSFSDEDVDELPPNQSSLELGSGQSALDSEIKQLSNPGQVSETSPMPQRRKYLHNPFSPHLKSLKHERASVDEIAELLNIEPFKAADLLTVLRSVL
jgi:hypothetical protein